MRRRLTEKSSGRRRPPTTAENGRVSVRAKHQTTHQVAPPGLTPNGNHPGTIQTTPKMVRRGRGQEFLFGIQAPKLETRIQLEFPIPDNLS